jgi:putative ABC transport system permease protein
VASASTETSVPVEVTFGSGEDIESVVESALVIDPAAYAVAHSTVAGSAAGADSASRAAGSGPGDGGGSLAALRGRAVAAGPGGDVPTHGTVRVKLPGADLGEVPVVAALPAMRSGGANLLLPPGLVPADVLAEAPTRAFVTLDPGADAAAARAALSRVGAVSGLDEWLQADAKSRTEISDKIMLVVMGLGALYALIGVVNSVVIGAAARRREFAEARITGLTRGQVIRSALLESSAVTVAGLLLGAVAAAGAILAAVNSTAAVTGRGTLTLPWALIGAVCAVALVVTGATSLITSWSATRRAPITLLAARE